MVKVKKKAKDDKIQPPLANLKGLRNGCQEDIALLQESLRLRGFCWLDVVDDPLHGLGSSAIASADSFLEAAQGKHVKLSYDDLADPPPQQENNRTAEEEQLQMARLDLQGACVYQFKSSVRLMTGDLMDDPKNFLGLVAGDPPPALVDAMRAVAAELDRASIDVMRQIAGPIFGETSAEELCDKRGVAMLSTTTNSSSSSSDDNHLLQMPRYGVVDCVRYSMAYGCPEVLVGAHIDPGLFVIALPQTTPGLELQDEEGNWIAPPPGAGVLWAGGAAVAGMPRSAIKGGIHTVVCTGCHPRQPRIAIWHELCTFGQLLPPLFPFLERNGLELRLGDMRGTMQVMSVLRAWEDDLIQSSEFLLEGGELDEEAATAATQLVIKDDGPNRHGGKRGWKFLSPRLQDIASTSGSWGGCDYHDEWQEQYGYPPNLRPPPRHGIVEIVPKGKVLKDPEEVVQSNCSSSYGTRAYAEATENWEPCKYASSFEWQNAYQFGVPLSKLHVSGEQIMQWREEGRRRAQGAKRSCCSIL